MIQCDCGRFTAEIRNFPKHTAGRLACYCDDCQAYLHHIGRAELLDSAGGTEIIPLYPADIKILSGADVLQCIRLSLKGKYRFLASCCRTPIGNTDPGSPWFGTFNRPFTVKNKDVEQTLGPIRSRIQGRFAKGTPPPGTSPKLKFSDALVVLPFLLKGFLTGKGKNSPFFAADGKTPAGQLVVLSLEERNRARERAGVR